MNPSPGSIVSDKHRREYLDNGFFILERVIPDDQLTMLRDEAAKFVAKVHAEMDAAGDRRPLGGLGDDFRGAAG